MNKEDKYLVDDRQCIYPGFSKDYTHFTFIQGRILLETKWIARYYVFGNFFPIYANNQQGRAIISVDKDKSLPLLKLVHTVFYKIPSSPITDFDVTQFIKQKDPQRLAVLCAQTLLNAQELKDHYQDLTKNIENAKIEVERCLPNATPPMAQEFLERLKKALETCSYKTINDQSHEFTKDKKKYYSNEKFLALKEQLSAFNKHWLFIGQYAQIYHQFFESGLHMSALNFSILLAQSLNNPYPFNSFKDVFSIITAFFYLSMKNNSNINTLNQSLDCYYHCVADHLFIKNPQRLDESLSKKKVKKWWCASISNPPMSRLLENLLSLRSLAPLENYKKIFHIQDRTFGDCMENSVANFVRVLSYNRTSQSHDIKTLQKSISRKISNTARSRLEKFLNDPTDHMYWADLIKNIPNIPQNSHTYETLVSLESLARILDYVFDLNIINNDQIKRPDFAEYYLSQIVKTFNMNISYLNKFTRQIIKNIDEHTKKSNVSIEVIISNTLIDEDLSINNKNTHTFDMLDINCRDYVAHAVYSISIKEMNNVINRSVSSFEPSKNKNFYENALIAAYLSKKCNQTINCTKPHNESLIFSLEINDSHYLSNMIKNSCMPTIINSKNNQYLLLNLIINTTPSQRRDLLKIIQQSSNSLPMDEQLQAILDQPDDDEDSDFDNSEYGSDSTDSDYG